MNPALHDTRSYHSHASLYTRTAVILTIITAVEIGLLFVEVLKPFFTPLLVVMAVQKLAMVVGTFMHLRDDKNVFRVVFLAPMAMAFLMIFVMTLLVMPHFAPFGGGYVKLAVQKSHDERTGKGAAAVAAHTPPKSKEEYEKLFAATTDFSTGEKIYAERCAACHRADGGGMPGLGPNMTDDCYLHGGSVHDLVNTVLNGIPGKAMVSFKGQISDDEIEQVALYVRGMRGKNVADGKACEGEKVAQ
jgi:mono/diheme cytochrome c family protein